MGQKSNYLEKALLDEVLGGTNFVPPATVYVALFTVAPTGAGGGTEASGGSYARAAVTNNAANWPNATGGSPAAKSNGTTITFVTATADWSAAANMVAFGIFDSLAAGNLLYFGSLTAPKPVINGDTPSFAPGTFAITET